MGTWGRIVIVSGGRYWAKEVSHSGYLSCLGLAFANLVPRDRAAAAAWVQKMKDIAASSSGYFRLPQECLETLKTWKIIYPEDRLWDSDAFRGPREAPGMGLLTDFQSNWPWEKEYTINLDLLCFAICGMPIYNLLNMPSTEGFVYPRDTEKEYKQPEVLSQGIEWNEGSPSTDFHRFIGNNVWRHLSWAHDTPKEFRYDFDQGPPLPVAAEAVRLNDLCPGSVEVSADLLLLSHRWQSSDEDIRVMALYSFVGMFTISHKYYRLIKLSQIRQEMDPRYFRYPAEMMMEMISATTYDLIQGSRHNSRSWNEREEFNPEWPRENVCVHYARFLDDPAHQEVAVARVVQIARARYSSGFLWGVAFSIIHCILVRIDARPGRPCQHTGTLPFLNGWYHTSISAPAGITALAQLFHIPPAPPSFPAKALPSCHPLTSLPVELMHKIADLVEHTPDLWAFVHAVPGMADVLGGRVRRATYLGDARLLLSMTPEYLDEHIFLCVDRRGEFTMRGYKATIYHRPQRLPEFFRIHGSFEFHEPWYNWVYSLRNSRLHKESLSLVFKVKDKGLSDEHKRELLPTWLKEDVTSPLMLGDFDRRDKDMERWEKAQEEEAREAREAVAEL